MNQKTALSKQNFVGVISETAHDLKTPLTALKLKLQMITNCLQKNNKSCINLDEIKGLDKEIDRMTRLVNDMLDIEKIGRKEFSLNLKVVNLQELFTDAIQQVSLISKHKIILKNKLEFF